MRTLRPGSLGEDVKVWQGFLQTKALYTGALDGQYGPGTLEATRAFQRNNELKDDGVVGNDTFGIAMQQGLVLTEDDPQVSEGVPSLGDAWQPPAAPADATFVIARDPRVVTNHKPGQLPAPKNPAPPVGFGYWQGNVTPGQQAFCSKVEGDPEQFPMGSFVQALIDGKLVGARVEWHTFQGKTGATGCFRGTNLLRPKLAAPQA